MPDWDEILTRDGPAVWRTAYRIVRLCRRTRSSAQMRLRQLMADSPAISPATSLPQDLSSVRRKDLS